MICGGLSSTLVPRSKYLGLGADCFAAAGAYASAAQAYLSANFFTKAAKFFKDARLFDEAADIILSNRSRVDPVLAEQCLNIARLHLHRERQPE